MIAQTGTSIGLCECPEPVRVVWPRPNRCQLCGGQLPAEEPPAETIELQGIHVSKDSNTRATLRLPGNRRQRRALKSRKGKR
jgi:hypothetical protein